MDAHGDVELGEDGAQDGQLLGVLLAVQGDVGAHEVHDLGAHEGDAREVRGARLALEDARDGTRVDGDGRGRGVHVLGRGRPHEVRADRLEGVHVRIQGARVGVVVLAGRELRGVDEDRDDHVVGELPGFAHELQVPVVQGAHGHDERLRAGQLRQRLGQLGARVGQDGTVGHVSILANVDPRARKRVAILTPRSRGDEARARPAGSRPQGGR